MFVNEDVLQDLKIELYLDPFPQACRNDCILKLLNTSLAPCFPS